MDMVLSDLGPGEVEGKGGTTIFALSSGAPPAGVAVIRASGPGVRAALQAMTGGVPAAREAALRWIADPRTGDRIDRGLVLFFPGPASFTGEDVLELHIHGGRAVIAAVLAGLGKLADFRPAEAGEFTRRAFVGGRMDLAEAEGLADLVSADTEAQRQAAIRQMQGSIRKQYESWADQLTRARGLIEANLDFSEEEGLGDLWLTEGRALAAGIGAEMEAALGGFDQARVIREGLEVMLLGPVNAGKSTLLNAIAGRDVAIVSAEPGTTRDLIEVAVDLGGLKVTLTDGAGIREAEGAVEREGVRRAQERAKTADLVLWLAASDETVTSESAAELWTIATKVDQAAGAELIRFRNEADFALSGLTGEGVDVLVAALARWASARWSGEPAIVGRERHRSALTEAVRAVNEAVDRQDSELAAEDLRLATEAIGRITGRIDVEAVLDVVFREFCIGK